MGLLTMTSVGLFDLAPSVRSLNPHKKQTREEALLGSPLQKRQFVMDVPIQVEGFAQAREYIDALLERSKHTPKPGGLCIAGDGGVGKSFILNDAHRRHPQLDTEIARITPLLVANFEGTPTAGKFLTDMLLQLGQEPSLIAGKVNKDLRDEFVKAVAECGTLGILFDESQHFWLSTKRNADRKAGAFGEYLKQLYDDTSLAFIFTGTPGLADLFESDSQIYTRWSGMLKLKAFEFGESFIKLLTALDQAIPLPEPAGLTEPKLAEQLHASTSGNFRLIKRLLAEAVSLAAKDGAKRLDIHYLAKAHFFIFCGRENPFK